MPLHPNGDQLVRANLDQISKGKQPKAVVIGVLTHAQVAGINADRKKRSQPLIGREILFHGRHAYNSRVVRDGYTIDDLVDQVRSALDVGATVHASPKMTTIQNRQGRADRYGNLNVCDMAVLECTSKHPRVELFSVIPRGDDIKPTGVSAAAVSVTSVVSIPTP